MSFKSITYKYVVMYFYNERKETSFLDLKIWLRSSLNRI